MNATEQFQGFYEAELLPHLQQLESRRQLIVRKLKSTSLILYPITAAVAILVAIWAPSPWLALIPVLLGVVLSAILYSRITKGFVADFKQSIIGRIVSFVDANLSYYPEECISQGAYMGSNIFLKEPDRYSGEDLVRGKVGKTEIQFSEVHSEYETTETDGEGHTRTEWHTIFKGIFFIADFNKQFQGETVVLPDKAEKLFGGLGRKFQSWNFSRSGKLVELEDTEFEERFVVYSRDQIEARYILSPGLMARIVDFAKRTGQEISLAFVASNICVAIPHDKNMFEPNLFASLLDRQLAQNYLDDLELAVGIVEELNLNTRIWTKE